MIGATFLTWLADALGATYSAWNLPIDIGWQIRMDALNYGLLCVLCALLVFYRVFTHWRLRSNPPAQTHYVLLPKLVGLLCLAPVLLFILQYLFVDIQGIDTLAQHETQMLLIQQHFGYNTLHQLLPLKPFTSSSVGVAANIVSGSTLAGRLNLLVDLAGPGILLPIISGIIALFYSNATAPKNVPVIPLRTRIRRSWFLFAGTALLLLIIFGRAPAAMACEYQAKQALSAGDYTGAMNWLNTSVALNPAIGQGPSYHLERGRADYYLQPKQMTDDAHIYLSSVYSSQNDYVDAYNELLTVWQAHTNDNMPWVTEQFSMTLEWLAEFSQRASTQVVIGINGLPIENNNIALQQQNAGGLLQDTASNALNQNILSQGNNQNNSQAGNQTSGILQQPVSPLSPQSITQQNANGSIQQNANASQRNNTLAPVVPRSDGDFEAMPWLTVLARVDSTNVYGQYVLGREFYSQSGYQGCMQYMQNVLYINQNPDVRSSAETYIALSMIRQGQVAQGRQVLMQAIKLDPDFNNNTAREELSGLH